MSPRITNRVSSYGVAVLVDAGMPDIEHRGRRAAGAGTGFPQGRGILVLTSSRMRVIT